MIPLVPELLTIYVLFMQLLLFMQWLCLNRSCTLKYILFIVSSIALNFVCTSALLYLFLFKVLRVFIFFTRFIIMNTKLVKGNTLKEYNSNIFQLRAKFLSPLCGGHYFEYGDVGHFFIFDVFKYYFSYNLKKTTTTKTILFWNLNYPEIPKI